MIHLHGKIDEKAFFFTPSLFLFIFYRFANDKNRR